jgi:alpha-galactosidase
MIPSISVFRTHTSIYRCTRLLLFRVALGVPLGMIAVTSPLQAIAVPQGEPIRYDAVAHTFRIDAGDVSYILGVNDSGDLQTLYWGKRLRTQDPSPAPSAEGGSGFELPVDTTSHEFVGWGSGLYVVPNLKVSFPDGNRDLVLHYLSHTIRGNSLTIKLKDIERDVIVDLLYEMDPATGVLARSARIENHTKELLTIEEAFAATWNLPSSGDYQLRYLTGSWASEFNLQKQALHPGKIVLESRRGSTGDEVNPWFAIERGAQPDQDTGSARLRGADHGRSTLNRTLPIVCESLAALRRSTLPTLSSPANRLIRRSSTGGIRILV